MQWQTLTPTRSKMPGNLRQNVLKLDDCADLSANWLKTSLRKLKTPHMLGEFLVWQHIARSLLLWHLSIGLGRGQAQDRFL